MKHLGAAVCLALILSAGPAATSDSEASTAADRNRIRTGKHVFDKWCEPCHAPTGRMAGTIALEAKYQGELPAALEERTDLTPEVIAYFVRHGVNFMPPFRKTEISDVDLAALSAYLAATPAQRKEALK